MPHLHLPRPPAPQQSEQSADTTSSTAATTSKQHTPTRQDSSSKLLASSSLSNSLDILTFQEEQDKQSKSSNWLQSRHQPSTSTFNPSAATIAKTIDTVKTSEKPSTSSSEAKSVLWDGRSGSIVDVQLFGTAIEDFLQKKPETSSPKVRQPGKVKSWFSLSPKPARAQEVEEDGATASCESTLCGTLKDLFVK